MLCGYMISMLLAAFVLREAPSLMSRAIKVSTFGLIKTDQSLHYENNYISNVTKISYLAQSVMG